MIAKLLDYALFLFLLAGTIAMGSVALVGLEHLTNINAECNCEDCQCTDCNCGEK
mgnify:CR=1 FL=1